MGKCTNPFFSETTNMIIKAKLYMNVHCMVLYKLWVLCSDMKFKMAATAGLSLKFDPMGKMLQNASSPKPLRQLKPNCPGMIITRSSTNSMFIMPIGNPRWLLPQDIINIGPYGKRFRYEIQNGGYGRTLDPIGKMFQNAFSLKPHEQLKPNWPGMIIWRSSKKFCFLCRFKCQDDCHHMS